MLGLVHALSEMGIPFFVTRDLDQALRHSSGDRVSSELTVARSTASKCANSIFMSPMAAAFCRSMSWQEL